MKTEIRRMSTAVSALSVVLFGFSASGASAASLQAGPRRINPVATLRVAPQVRLSPVSMGVIKPAVSFGKTVARQQSSVGAMSQQVATHMEAISKASMVGEGLSSANGSIAGLLTGETYIKTSAASATQPVSAAPAPKASAPVRLAKSGSLKRGVAAMAVSLAAAAPAMAEKVGTIAISYSSAGRAVGVVVGLVGGFLGGFLASSLYFRKFGKEGHGGDIESMVKSVAAGVVTAAVAAYFAGQFGASF